MLPAVASLTKSADFQRLSRLARKRVFPAFIMLALPSPAPGMPFRFGLTVSRKVGNAVVRNRTKRRLRMAVRCACAERTPALDIVLIARAMDKEIPFTALVEDIRKGIAALEVGA